MQRRDLARSVVRDSSSFFAPHFARTSCVNPLLLRRACRSVDHRAYQTNSRGFVKHTRSFKVNIGRLILEVDDDDDGLYTARLVFRAIRCSFERAAAFGQAARRR